MSEVRPVLGGKPSCPKWDGVWLIGKYMRSNEVVSRVPASCSSWDCEVCGDVNRRRWFNETKAAFRRIAREEDVKIGMLTLTFRTKKKDWSWSRFKAMRGFSDKVVEEGKLILEKCEDKKILQECQKFQNRYGEFAGALFRYLMTPKQMSKYITACERSFFRWMRETYDVEVYWRGVREFTKQNMAHMHYVMSLPEGFDVRAARQ